jgi:hypothetical protein
MDDELRDNAKQHGILAADHLARKLHAASITPVRASELLNAYVRQQANVMMANGSSRADVGKWVRAVEASFDERLAELAKTGSADQTHEPAALQSESL